MTKELKPSNVLVEAWLKQRIIHKILTKILQQIASDFNTECFVLSFIRPNRAPYRLDLSRGLTDSEFSGMTI